MSSHLTLITTHKAVVGRMKSAPSMDIKMTCERAHIDRVMIRGRYTKLRVWRLGIVLSLCGAQGLTLPPAARHCTSGPITVGAPAKLHGIVVRPAAAPRAAEGKARGAIWCEPVRLAAAALVRSRRAQSSISGGSGGGGARSQDRKPQNPASETLDRRLDASATATAADTAERGSRGNRSRQPQLAATAAASAAAVAEPHGRRLPAVRC